LPCDEKTRIGIILLWVADVFFADSFDRIGDGGRLHLFDLGLQAEIFYPDLLNIVDEVLKEIGLFVVDLEFGGKLLHNCVKSI
jgi:hypothetical protein